MGWSESCTARGAQVPEVGPCYGPTAAALYLYRRLQADVVVVPVRLLQVWQHLWVLVGRLAPAHRCTWIMMSCKHHHTLSQMSVAVEDIESKMPGICCRNGVLDASTASVLSCNAFGRFRHAEGAQG